MTTREVPHNLPAEASVIGSLLLSRSAIDEAAEIVSAADFYRGAHRTMFETIVDMHGRGEPVDSVTVVDELERRGQLADVGGPAAIMELVNKTPTSANVNFYARIVADHATRRRLIDVGGAVTNLGFDVETAPSEAVDRAATLVADVVDRDAGEVVGLQAALAEAFKSIEDHQTADGPEGLATGFVDLDLLTAGLLPGQLVVIAARPAMGKSTFAADIARSVAVKQRKTVFWASLEMSKQEVVMRLIAAESGVLMDRLRRKNTLQDDDWPKLSQAVGRMGEAPMFIDDTAGITLLELRAKARRIKSKHGLALVIVDYLQLMQSHKRAENRTQEVSELSRGLKVLAKDLGVPVIALSQLSRKTEERIDRRPHLSDLRESGSIEQDADVVAFIYRDEVYDPTPGNAGVAELIVAKQRNGPLGTVNLTFQGPYVRFQSAAKSDAWRAA